MTLARRSRALLFAALVFALHYVQMVCSSDSDMVGRLYKIWSSGGSMDPLPIAEKALPQVAKNRLVQFDSLQWGVLPGLVQRAILWDTGIVMTSSSDYVQILTVCGQTMADLMLDVAVVQDIVSNSSTCVLSKCGGNAQFLESCLTDVIVPSVRCFVDKTTLGTVPSFSGVYWAADGGNEEAPAPVLRDHTSLNTSVNKLYAIHLVDKVFSGVRSCETEARMIIPCGEGNQNDGRICTPSNGATLDAWLKYLSTPNQSTFTTTSSVLLIILFLLIVALCALIYYLVRYKVDFKSLDSYDNSHTSNLLSNENMLNGSTPMDVFARSGGRGSRGADPTLSNDALCNKSAILRRFVSDPTIVTKRISVSQITFLRVLSKGGNGEVWLGQYESRYVALKCLLASKRDDISSLERFSDELRLASVLEHPRIVAFCGVAWQSLLHLCAVTEYMERGDLETVLSHPTATSMVWGKEKLPMAMDIAEALVYLHSLEPVVIHRDLKSKNILLDRRLRAKLSDFGLSRETSVEDTMTNGVGTILWSAPEVLEGKRYDEKADIFSYGIVLSEIDTCMLPYGFNKERGGKNKMKSMQIVHLVAEGKLLPTFREDCPPEIVDLARDCLELNPEKRPTAMEVVFRLRSKVLPLLNNGAFDEE